MWYDSSEKSHGRSCTRAAIDVPSGGKTWPRLAISARRFAVSSRCSRRIRRPAQAARVASSCGGNLLKGRDRRAGPVILQDQLESALHD